MDFLIDPRAIEVRSFELIRGLIAQSGITYSPAEEAVVSRVIHATGDPGYASRLRVHPRAVAAAVASLQAKRTIVTDVTMVSAGINTAYFPGVEVLCAVKEPETGRLAAQAGITRSMAGIRLLGERLTGAVVVIGNAPTALFELLRLAREENRQPAAVVGLPVGFVGAAEAKEELLASSLPYFTIPGTRGGSSPAVAVANALLLLAGDKGDNPWPER